MWPRLVAIVVLVSMPGPGCRAPAPAPEEPSTTPIASPSPEPEPEPADCAPSSFEPTDDGFVWIVGDQRVRFVASEEADDLAYNYRRRQVRLEAVDGGTGSLSADCYTETDCDVPPDAEGRDRWCLVSNGLDGSHGLFDLLAPLRPCETPLELLEAMAIRSTSPTCLRTALVTYPGAAYDELGFFSEIMAEEGVPAEVIAEVDALAKEAADADRGHGDPEDDARSAAALRTLRERIAPYTTTSAAWRVDLLAARALARLEDRYPATLVGPEETFYDLRSEDPWDIVPTPAPWARP